jgi:hypothetical protein
MRLLASILIGVTALAAPPAARNARTWIRVPMAASGAPVAARELKASVGGVQARVAAVRAPGDDMILMLVLDITGDLSLADLARQALTEGIQTLPPKTWISVMRAQDGLQVLLDPTEDRAKVAETIRAYAVSGKAGLLDTIDTAARLSDAILARANVRLALVYVTDSNVYNYREDFTNPVINSSDSRDMSRHFPEGLVKDKISKLDASLGARQSPVFVIHLDYRGDRLNEAYQSGLMQLAATTGGAAVFCRSATDVGSTIGKALETIGSLYSVTVDLPRRAGKNIQVQLEAGGRQLSYRSRFSLEER